MPYNYHLYLKQHFTLDDNFLTYLIASYFATKRSAYPWVNCYHLKKIIQKHVKKNYPVQYLIGHSYFYNEPFIVNKNVLIPRLDSEKMIEEIIATKAHHRAFLEVGTGSGALIITLARMLPNNYFEAVDISKKALRVAKANQKKAHTNITFWQSDLWAKITHSYDFIIANLPYLDVSEATPALAYEPHISLYASQGGLALIYRFLDQLLGYLKPNGCCYLEHGATQQDVIVKYLEQNKNLKITTNTDYANRPRYVVIRRI